MVVWIILIVFIIISPVFRLFRTESEVWRVLPTQLIVRLTGNFASFRLPFLLYYLIPLHDQRMGASGIGQAAEIALAEEIVFVQAFCGGAALALFQQAELHEIIVLRKHGGNDYSDIFITSA